MMRCKGLGGATHCECIDSRTQGSGRKIAHKSLGVISSPPEISVLSPLVAPDRMTRMSAPLNAVTVTHLTFFTATSTRIHRDCSCLTLSITEDLHRSKNASTRPR